jgi:hypothetical protein
VISDNPAICVEVLNLPDEAAAPWREWYDATYLAARAEVPGVVAARRGRGFFGSVKDVVVYDLANTGIALSPAWAAVEQRIRTNEATSPQLALHRENAVPYLLRQISTTVPGAYTPPNVNVLHMSFFVVEGPHQDELNDWYALEHIDSIMQVPGYHNVRRYQGVEDTRQFVGLYDVDSREVALGEVADRAMQSRWSDRVRAKLVLYRERRLFDVERVLLGPAARG